MGGSADVELEGRPTCSRWQGTAIVSGNRLNSRRAGKLSKKCRPSFFGLAAIGFSARPSANSLACTHWSEQRREALPWRRRHQLSSCLSR